ncbi:MAG: pyridoxamine 5'-phosphate oxidase [Xanthomonadales bacterium]|nr:pyridoxamine 5'-phosphate oxidase [Xanthomonadales bacterium]
MTTINTSNKQLDDVLKEVWKDLVDGVSSARNPFHTPAVSSLGTEGPEVRTVVLRGADPGERELFFHTDARSPKYAQLQADPRLEWMFYDRERKIQLRARGHCTVHREDNIALQRWQDTSDNSRWCYTSSEGPGTPIETADAVQHEDEGYVNFVAVRCRIERLDWLYLRAGGHLRCQFLWVGDSWDGQWVAP